jgi:hypothetical protein
MDTNMEKPHLSVLLLKYCCTCGMRCRTTLSASLLAGMEQQCSANRPALALHVLADQTVPSGYAPLPTTTEQTQRMYVCQRL